MNHTLATEWLSGRQARVRGGGLTVTALLKAAAIGEVQTLARAGEPLRFRAADLDRLAQERAMGNAEQE
jgi:hypothetical protein